MRTMFHGWAYLCTFLANRWSMDEIDLDKLTIDTLQAYMPNIDIGKRLERERPVRCIVCPTCNGSGDIEVDDE